MVEETDARLKWVSLEDAADPPGGLIECLKNRHWTYKEGKGILFWKDKHGEYPQCNGDEATSRMLTEKMYPWATVKFVPVVFRRINIRDYAS